MTRAIPFVGAAILLALNLAKSHRWSSSGAVETYWARFWMLGYSDGASRRALLGQLVRWTVGAEVSWLTLSAVGIAVTGGVLGLVAVPYARLHTPYGVRATWRQQTAFESVAAIALVFSGAAAVVPLQLIGDPLQVALLLALGYGIAAPKLGARWRAPVAIAVGAVAVLVHEASAFLVVPFLYATACNQLRGVSAGKVVALVTLAAAAPIGLSHLLVQHTLGHGTSLRLMDGSLFTVTENPLPSLGTLWHEEVVARFGSIRGIAKTASFVPRIGLPIIAAVVALTGLCRDVTLPRRFTYLMVCSLPLYVIAHDWGRFATYSLLLAIALPSPGYTLLDVHCAVQRKTALAACVVLVVCRTNRDWLMRGLSPIDFAYAAAAALLCVAVVMFEPTQEREARAS